MGIITSLLFAGGVISVFKIPLWVVLAAQAAIALGCDAEYRRGLGAHNPGSGHYFRYSFLCN